MGKGPGEGGSGRVASGLSASSRLDMNQSESVTGHQAKLYRINLLYKYILKGSRFGFLLNHLKAIPKRLYKAFKLPYYKDYLSNFEAELGAEEIIITFYF